MHCSQALCFTFICNQLTAALFSTIANFYQRPLSFLTRSGSQPFVYSPSWQDLNLLQTNRNGLADSSDRIQHHTSTAEVLSRCLQIGRVLCLFLVKTKGTGVSSSSCCTQLPMPTVKLPATIPSSAAGCLTSLR